MSWPRPFWVLMVNPRATVADVRMLPAPLAADPLAAELEADLERDGARRRWLSAPPAVVEHYRRELEDLRRREDRPASTSGQSGRPGARPGGFPGSA